MASALMPHGLTVSSDQAADPLESYSGGILFQFPAQRFH
jgi:hypothetical protein